MRYALLQTFSKKRPLVAAAYKRLNFSGELLFLHQSRNLHRYLHQRISHLHHIRLLRRLDLQSMFPNLRILHRFSQLVGVTLFVVR